MNDAEREGLDLRAREVELQRTRLAFEMDAERERLTATRTQAVAAARQAGTAIVAILVSLVISLGAQVSAAETAERALSAQVTLAEQRLAHEATQFLQRERRTVYIELVRRARSERVVFRHARRHAVEHGRLPAGFGAAEVSLHYSSAQAAAADARFVGTRRMSELAERVGLLCWELRRLARRLVEDPATAADPAWDVTVRELGERTREFLAVGQEQMLAGSVRSTSAG
jgi:hypothetical protein